MAATTVLPELTTAPTPGPVDLAHIPAAPSSTWTKIRWVAVPDRTAIAAPTPDPLATPEEGTTSQTTIWGWSRGYVAFSVVVHPQGDTAGTAVVSSAHSSDGVAWQPGNTFQLSLGQPDISVSGVYEGPSGLLAVGMTGACGDYWINGLWASPDGKTWTKVDMKRTFGANGIERVTGGAAGFVATGETGNVLWTSTDGRTWRAIDFTDAVFKHSRVDDGTAFGSGFVLAGSTVLPGARGCGANISDPSAPATPTPPMRTPGAWWSADGKTWTKTELPGAASAFSVDSRLYRITDRSVVLSAWGFGPDDGHGQAWLSTDGRTWQPLGLIVPQLDDLLTDGRHAVKVVISDRTETGEQKDMELALSSVRDDASLIPIEESGDRPLGPAGVTGTDVWALRWAIGPTGILATNGTQIWLGLPS